ncbi:MAG: YqgE/AlgH family protein [Nitriliruptoraceae bacterium]
MVTWLTGRLLVAAPALDDPNFERAVVLILDHDEDGAIGVVLNRASAVPVRDTIADWAELAAVPPVVFGGGPVEPTAVVALGVATSVATPDTGTAILGRIRLVDLDQDPTLAAGELERVRIFAGYAGWAPEQLEDEIAQGAWFAVDAMPGDVFTEEPAGLWHAVLRRQPGELRLLATFPADPTLN